MASNCGLYEDPQPAMQNVGTRAEPLMVLIAGVGLPDDVDQAVQGVAKAVISAGIIGVGR